MRKNAVMLVFAAVTALTVFPAHGGESPPPDSYPQCGDYILMPYGNGTWYLGNKNYPGFVFAGPYTKEQVMESVRTAIESCTPDRANEPCFNRDSDGDGYSDCAEIAIGTDPDDGGDVPWPDGLPDVDPDCIDCYPDHPCWNLDSDGDGFPDCDEIADDTDPTDPGDYPPPPDDPFTPYPPLPPWYPYPDPEPPLGDDGGGDDGGGGTPPGGDDDGGGDGGGGTDPGGGDDGGGDDDGGTDPGDDGGGGDSGGGGDDGGGGGDSGGGGGSGGGGDDGGGGGGGSGGGGGGDLDPDPGGGGGGGGDPGGGGGGDGGGGGGGDPGGGGGGGSDDEEEDDGDSSFTFPDRDASWDGVEDWKKPEPTEDMESTIEQEELDDMRDGISDAVGGLGLSPDALDRYSPRDFSVTFRLPVGGTISNLQWKTYTFNLSDFEMSGVSSDIGKAGREVRDVIYLVLKALASLVFLVRVCRHIWG